MKRYKQLLITGMPHQLKPPLHLTESNKECTCHKFIRLHDGNCDVHGFVRKQEAAVNA